MDRQIVDPDLGLYYNAGILPGDPHFEIEKNIHVYIYITANITIARLRVVMLNGTRSFT